VSFIGIFKTKSLKPAIFGGLHTFGRGDCFPQSMSGIKTDLGFKGGIYLLLEDGA